MNRAFARAGVAPLAVAVCLAGCSAGSSPGPAGTSGATSSPASPGVDAAFKARANAACKPFANWNDDHPFNFPEFDPYHPAPQTLPKVGAFFDTSPANHSFTTVLRALGEPAAGRDLWRGWLTQLDMAVALDRAQIADAKRADASAFAANFLRVVAQQPALDVAGRSVGFAATDPCAKVL